ncbi:MAG: hypothetical protein Q4A92_04670 [Corynebacterium sp.]|nr:hypothetical protein [Corynebacterium sp.]
MKLLIEELRWTFTWPFGWLQGVLLNVVLAAAYLLLWPLASNEHYDIVLLFTVYFATFIMADVTTTNIFGHDIVRMTRALQSGRSFISLVLLKNLVQALIIILPMVLVTMAITYMVSGPGELVLVIPGILYPMLLWLGVGNVISVLYPVIPAPIPWRIQSIRGGTQNWKLHAPLLISYAIPWVLYALTTLTDLPGNLNILIQVVAGRPHPWESGLVLLIAACVIYALLTRLSVQLVEQQGFTLRMQTDLVRTAPLDPHMKQAAEALLPRR